MEPEAEPPETEQPRPEPEPESEPQPEPQPQPQPEPEPEPQPPPAACIPIHDGTCASVAEFESTAEQRAANYREHKNFKTQWGLGHVNADYAYAHLSQLKGEDAAPGARGSPSDSSTPASTRTIRISRERRSSSDSWAGQSMRRAMSGHTEPPWRA